MRELLVVLILLLAVACHGAPNYGAGGQLRSASAASAGAFETQQLYVHASTSSGEAPLKVEFEIVIIGSTVSTIPDIYINCEDQAGNRLRNTSSQEPHQNSLYIHTYQVDGFCYYEDDNGGVPYTPAIFVLFQGSWVTPSVFITVTEPIGAIGVDLTVDPLTSTETTDFTLTATVTGESGEETVCRFWHNLAGCGTPLWAGGGACGAHQQEESAPGVAPLDTGVCTDATYLAVAVPVPGTPLDSQVGVVCQRNLQEATAIVPYRVSPDLISVQSFTANPAHGETSGPGGTLDNVELEVVFGTSCDTTAGTFDIYFDCDNDGIDEFTSLAENLADYVDDDGLVTYALQADGLSGECDGYLAGTHTAEVTLDCENAVTTTSTTGIVAQDPPVTETFFFNAYGDPASGTAALNNVHPKAFGWDTTLTAATGDVTNVEVDCVAGTGAEFAGLTIPDPSGPFDLFNLTGEPNCDYAAAGVYQGSITGTRGTTTYTAYFDVDVAPAPVAPALDADPGTFQVAVVEGENPPSTFAVTITNTSTGGTLNWADNASESQPWLACTPNTAPAPLGPGESSTSTCTITSADLLEGSYSATVTYTDATAIPQSETVTFNLQVNPEAGIHLNVDATALIGPSPLAVEFSTVDTSGGTDNTISTWHDNSAISQEAFSRIYYRWDFNDPTSGTWSTTGNSRNKMTGPLAAHVYEPTSFPDTCTGGVACKKFYPTLTAEDEFGNSASWTGTVQVVDPSATGANGWGDNDETVCISRDTSFTGCPLTCGAGAGFAECVTSTGTVQSLLTTWAGAARRILFKGGQTWTWSGLYALSTNGPGMIGSYGTGKATFHDTIDNSIMTFGGDNWRVQDISFTGSGAQINGAVFGHNDQIKNLLFQRNSTQASVFFSVFGLPTRTGADDTIHRHLFFVDNTWGALTSPYGKYNIFFAAWGMRILGNTFGQSFDEHVVRMETGENVLVSNNFFPPGKVGKTSLNFRHEPVECCASTQQFCGRSTRYIVVQDNNFQCYSACVSGISLSDPAVCTAATYLPSYDVIVERNFMDHVGGNAEGTHIQFQSANLQRLVIRNNITDDTGLNYSKAIIASPGGKLFNNTCFRSDVTALGVASCIYPNSSLECRNNVLYAPNWTGAKRMIFSGSCDAASTNLSDTPGGGITSNPFTVWPPTTREEAAPHGSSQILNAGTAIPSLFDDARGYCRPTTGFDAGALERGAANCNP